MASLTGTKIKDTYDALLKVSDNGALDGTLQTITDGLGNNSALSLSTAGASVGGTLAVSGNLTVDTNTLFVDAANNRVGLGTLFPSERLTVVGNVSVSSGGLETYRTDGGTGLVVNGGDLGNSSYIARFKDFSNNDKVVIKGDGDISFRDSSANEAFYWDASAASLGIGTVPAAPLHINATNANACIINVTGTSPNYIFDVRDDNVSQFRVDSSGNVGIGVTPAAKLHTSSSVTGNAIGALLANSNTSGSADSASLNFGLARNDGFLFNVSAIKFVKNQAWTGTASTIDGYLSFSTINDESVGERMRITADGYIIQGDVCRSVPSSVSASIRFEPMTDDSTGLGWFDKRWDEVFSVNGTINTSDANEKQQIEDLDEAELKVAIRIKGLIKKFKWNSAVDKKGDDARIHIGVIAQDVKEAFELEGLDAHRYSLFTQDTWWEKEIIEIDADGNEIVKVQSLEEYEDGAVEKTRLGVRYSELLAFVIAAI